MATTWKHGIDDAERADPGDDDRVGVGVRHRGPVNFQGLLLSRDRDHFAAEQVDERQAGAGQDRPNCPQIRTTFSSCG